MYDIQSIAHRYLNIPNIGRWTMATAMTTTLTKGLIVLIGGLVALGGTGGLLYHYPSAWPWLLMIVGGIGVVGWVEVSK